MLRDGVKVSAEKSGGRRLYLVETRMLCVVHEAQRWNVTGLYVSRERQAKGNDLRVDLPCFVRRRYPSKLRMLHREKAMSMGRCSIEILRVMFRNSITSTCLAGNMRPCMRLSQSMSTHCQRPHAVSRPLPIFVPVAGIWTSHRSKQLATCIVATCCVSVIGKFLSFHESHAYDGPCAIESNSMLDYLCSFTGLRTTSDCLISSHIASHSLVLKPFFFNRSRTPLIHAIAWKADCIGCQPLVKGA